MIGAAAIALLADALLGEPPTSVHPTVAMGQWIGAGRKRRSARSDAGAFLEGAFVVGGGALLAAGAAGLVDIAARGHPLLRGLALKPAMSLRALLDAARRVQRSLERGDLVAARQHLGRDLVSRDTSELSAAEVAGAAIESVAENFSDSVVAPLLAFRFGGLAAAYAYRLVNTADAMLGYRTPELEWFGKAAARTDDVLNIVPSRAAAVLLCLCAPIGDGSIADAARTAFEDADRTASPNAGWPMAAMAGALGVRLTKRDHYALNDRGREPSAEDVGRSGRIVFAASVVTALAVDTL